MTCDFMFFSTVFQSYQDDGWVIMNGCVEWNPVYGYGLGVRSFLTQLWPLPNLCVHAIQELFF